MKIMKSCVKTLIKRSLNKSRVIFQLPPHMPFPYTVFCQKESKSRDFVRGNIPEMFSRHNGFPLKSSRVTWLSQPTIGSYNFRMVLNAN